VAPAGRVVTWKNLTGGTQSVVFDFLGIASGPIAPGGDSTYSSPTPVSITYHSGVRPKMRGHLQVLEPTVTSPVP